MKRVLIWGSGAIGGTVGAFLHRAGHDITFVDIGAEHIAAIRDPARGLHIYGPVAEMTIRGKAFLPMELNGVWDCIFLCVKGYDTLAATHALAPHLAEDGYVVSLQNGLCEDRIAGVVGRHRTVGGFINFGADLMEPGRIMYGNRAAFVIGELDGEITTRMHDLLSVVKDFEPEAILSPDVHSYLWGKLAYTTFLYAQALGDAGIADCLERSELLPLWQGLAAEASAVALSQGIRPRGFNGYEPAAFAPGSDVENTKASVAAMATFNRASGKTHSGGWRDLAVRKKKTEIEMIFPIRDRAREKGIAVPLTDRLIAMIHEIEEGARHLTNDNLTELLRAATPAAQPREYAERGVPRC